MNTLVTGLGNRHGLVAVGAAAGARAVTSAVKWIACLAIPWFVQCEGADVVSAAFQRGLVAEETKGDLELAARAYGEAVQAHAEQRTVAATALYRLAEVQRRMGRTNAAVAGYARLVKEFPEQSRLIELARPHLGRRPAPAADSSEVAAVERLLREQLELAEQLLAEAQRKADVGAVAPLEVLVPKRQVLRLRRELLRVQDPSGRKTRVEQRPLLVEEVGITENWLNAARMRRENGAGSAEELLLARQAVLEAKRELAEFDAAAKKASEIPADGVVF